MPRHFLLSFVRSADFLFSKAFVGNKELPCLVKPNCCFSFVHFNMCPYARLPISSWCSFREYRYSILLFHHDLSFSVTKFIRIGIADKNDNPPYFDKALYEAEVDENEDIQHTVLTVTAKDHDECKSDLN